MRNLSIGRARADARRAAAAERTVPAADMGPATDDLVAGAELQHLLATLVMELKEPERRIVLLRYYEELDSPEIAALLGMPAATVRWRLARAHETLRRRMTEPVGADRAWALVAAVSASPRPRVQRWALAAGFAVALAGLPGSPRAPGGAVARAEAALAPEPRQRAHRHDGPVAPAPAECRGELATLRDERAALAAERIRRLRPDRLFEEGEPNGTHCSPERQARKACARARRPPDALPGTPRALLARVQLIRRHPLAAYHVLAVALAWAWWVPLLVRGAVVRPGAWPTHVPGLVAPALAAFVVTVAIDGRPGVRALAARVLRWRIGVVAALVALSPAIGFAGLAAAGLAGPLAGVGRMNGYPVATPAALFALVLLSNGLGEELGWRGFAYARHRRRHRSLIASLAVAPVWALWHLPLFGVLDGYGGFHPGGLIGFAFSLAGASIVLGWLYDRAGQSVLAPALFHATFNLCTATPAARGVPAAVLTTAVMVAALAIAIGGLRRGWLRRGSMSRGDAPMC